MSVSGISSLLTSLILKKCSQQSDSESQTTTASTETNVDTVSLSASLAEIQSRVMADAQSSLLGTGSGGSGGSLMSALLGSDKSTDSMTSVLMDVANAQFMKANPKLVEKMLAQAESVADASDSSSSESEIESLRGIDLSSSSLDTLFTLLKLVSQSTGSEDSSTSAKTRVV